jgi:hypothetical protein
MAKLLDLQVKDGAGNHEMALMEIPFLLIPLVLIYLGHPFRK